MEVTNLISCPYNLHSYRGIYVVDLHASVSIPESCDNSGLDEPAGLVLLGQVQPCHSLSTVDGAPLLASQTNVAHHLVASSKVLSHSLLFLYNCNANLVIVDRGIDSSHEHTAVSWVANF